MYKWIKKIKLFKSTTENSLTKEKTSDKLSQPKNGSNVSNGDDKSKNKSIFKKILWWVLGLGILAAIIAPIVVSCTRQTEVNLSSNATVSVKDNNINFFDQGSNYLVKNDTTSLLSVYYRATQSQFTYYFRDPEYWYKFV